MVLQKVSTILAATVDGASSVGGAVSVGGTISMDRAIVGGGSWIIGSVSIDVCEKTNRIGICK